jgi:tetratricopeptide (TPR) repeat protein
MLCLCTRAPGQLENARTDIDEAVRISRSVRLPANLSAGLTSQALILRLSGDLEGALSSCEEALALTRSELWDQGDGAKMIIEASALTQIGSVHLSRGDAVRALSYFNRALIDYRQHPRGLTGTILVLSNMGSAHLRMHQPTKALEFFKQCAEAADILAHPIGAVNALIGFGAVDQQYGQFDGALSFFQQAQDVIDRLRQNSLLAARVKRLIGEVSLDMANLETARNACGQALAMASQVAPRSLEMARCLIAVGRVASAFGEASEAIMTFKQALVIAETAALTSEETVYALRNLLTSYLLTGDITSAESCRVRAAEVEALRAGRF